MGAGRPLAGLEREPRPNRGHEPAHSDKNAFAGTARALDWMTKLAIITNGYSLYSDRRAPGAVARPVACSGNAFLKASTAPATWA